jgi:hypothetical protein
MEQPTSPIEFSSLQVTNGNLTLIVKEKSENSDLQASTEKLQVSWVGETGLSMSATIKVRTLVFLQLFLKLGPIT